MTLAVPVLLGGVGVGIVGWSAWRLRAVVRLLLVEEDPLIRGLLELLLARHGYEVATAGDGSAGIRMAREVRPALVVSGVNLPATGEVGLLAAIRAEPGLEQTPVLFLSGDMSPDSVASATELGAVGYLTKPVVAEELLATIQGLLKAPSDASR
ncbi:MAG: response regulator [Planctomycetes bacterium]|nr:response regulator [Planctomycetota bacterium]